MGYNQNLCTQNGLLTSFDSFLHRGNAAYNFQLNFKLVQHPTWGHYCENFVLSSIVKHALVYQHDYICLIYDLYDMDIHIYVYWFMHDISLSVYKYILLYNLYIQVHVCVWPRQLFQPHKGQWPIHTQNNNYNLIKKINKAYFHKIKRLRVDKKMKNFRTILPMHEWDESPANISSLFPKLLLSTNWSTTIMTIMANSQQMKRVSTMSQVYLYMSVTICHWIS